ncbi:MAG: CAP domain-containing protein [Candidatus Aminicenantes bacterium]|nr:MAG: CAP domain-containing protein [Candidatus Aminicenantes bacterium]
MAKEKNKTNDERSRELSSFFKFFLMVQLVIGLIFLFNGWIKSNVGYDSIEALGKGKSPGETGKIPEIPSNRPPSIRPNNIQALKQDWTIPQPPADSIDFINTLEKKIFDESNRERTKRNLQPVTWEDYLAGTARYHSSDMGTKQFFSHINPDNVGPFFRIAKLHRRYIGTGGENILKMTKTDSDPELLAQKIVNTWMNSTGHRQNLLDEDYTTLGVGCVEALDKNNTAFLYVTQLFGKPAAYLQRDFPTELNKGQVETIAVESVNPVYLAAVSGEVVDLKTGKAEPFQLKPLTGTTTNQKVSTGNIKAPRQEGAYQLVFHFPLEKDPRTISVIPGPIFSVK